MNNLALSQNLFKFNEGISFLDEFVHLSSRVSELANEVGIQITPFRNSNLPHFSRKSEEEKSRVIWDLRNYVTVCEKVQDDGGDLKDPVTVTWMAIKEMGMRPPSDLFSHITADNVIEFHNQDGIQIFRNFHFYQYCSYSLEELYCFPWSTLYSRNEEALNSLLRIFGSFYCGEMKTGVRTGIAPHIIEEIYSPFKYKIYASQDYAAPLFDLTGRPIASIIVETGRLVNAPLSPEEEERILLNHQSYFDFQL
ncbi:MAG: hypothetical protein AB7F86_00340 [Bdellovibrionales bacterium]